MAVTAASTAPVTTPLSHLSSDNERWDAWKLRYAAADRRTAAMMRVIGAILVLAALGWTAWALASYPR